MTTPELAKQFLGPEDVGAAEVVMDVRPGGAYHIVMQQPDGERWLVAAPIETCSGRNVCR